MKYNISLYKMYSLFLKMTYILMKHIFFHQYFVFYFDIFDSILTWINQLMITH